MVVKANAWWPFNILFMLLLVVALVQLIEQGGAKRLAAAVALFLVAGAFVEFLWFGVGVLSGRLGATAVSRVASRLLTVDPGNPVALCRERQRLGARVDTPIVVRHEA